jgi:hypothetical protein
MKYSAVHVGNVLRQPWAVAKRNELCKEMKIESANAMDILREAVPRAAYKLVDLMDNARSEELQSRNAKDIFQIIYGKPKERVEVSSNTENLTPAQIDALAALLPPELDPPKRN